MNLAARTVIVCAAVAATAGAAFAQEFPGGRWLAEEISGSGVDPAVQSTLEFTDGGEAGGSGGCNRYRSEARIDGTTISFGAIAATRMACAAPAMEQEQRFFEALGKAASWRQEDDRLLLLDDGGSVAMRFGREREATITIPVPDAAEVQSATVRYTCGTGPLSVEYINAGPVSLAVLTVDGEFLVMSNVLAASGARYAGGRYIWWTKGDTGDLYDLTKGDDAPPVSCTEAQQ